MGLVWNVLLQNNTFKRGTNEYRNVTSTLLQPTKTTTPVHRVHLVLPAMEISIGMEFEPNTVGGVYLQQKIVLIHHLVYLMLTMIPKTSGILKLQKRILCKNKLKLKTIRKRENLPCIGKVVIVGSVCYIYNLNIEYYNYLFNILREELNKNIWSFSFSDFILCSF